MQKKFLRMTLVCAAVILNLCTGCRGPEDTILNLTEEPSVNSEIPTEETVQEKTEIEENASIYVYVCGAVMYPGVYELASESRIYEAVNLAGGLTEDADETLLNQAELLNDGQKIYVPYIGEADTVQRKDAEEGTDRVNINTASLESLMTLQGVGESRARSIIAYREENGEFQTIEDIMNVTGIKEGLYGKIKEQITVN